MLKPLQVSKLFLMLWGYGRFMSYATNNRLIRMVVLSGILVGVGISHAGSERFPLKSWIMNEEGDKCWYTQKVSPKSTYFHGNLTSIVGIIVFDDPQCMSDSEIGSGLGLEVNKSMINSEISRWYGPKDAKFQTGIFEMLMFNGSLLQKKGKCIQSSKYPLIGITVDYFIENNSVTGVIHGKSIQGCKKRITK